MSCGGVMAESNEFEPPSVFLCSLKKSINLVIPTSYGLKSISAVVLQG